MMLSRYPTSCKAIFLSTVRYSTVQAENAIKSEQRDSSNE